MPGGRKGCVVPVEFSDKEEAAMLNRMTLPIASFSKAATSVIIVGALFGCGGGGGGGGGDDGFVPIVDASPGGIWEGTDPIAGIALIGVVTETGEARFIRSDGMQSFGQATVSGNSVSGNYTSILPYGFVFEDGSSWGTGTLSGTVRERQSITATFSFRTSAGLSSTGTGTFTYNSLYDRDSSLATIAGNYRDGNTGAVVNVNSNGVIFSQDAVTGCVVNGQASIIDSRYNVYRIEYSFTGCQGFDSYLNGTTATGLGVLDNTSSPEYVIIGVTNTSARYALTQAFPRI